MKSFNYSLFVLLGLVLANTTRAELDVDVVGPVTINQNKAYWAGSSIETQGSVVVGAGGNLSLRAGDLIFLQPGFRVEAN
ncbi:MAG: hypothetical protein NTU80_13265, partial [Verrucomicrobia bacterium]|nr:hypothetical protein [Verrucomicrobiota bacterium]